MSTHTLSRKSTNGRDFFDFFLINYLRGIEREIMHTGWIKSVAQYENDRGDEPRNSGNGVTAALACYKIPTQGSPFERARLI